MLNSQASYMICGLNASCSNSVESDVTMESAKWEDYVFRVNRQEENG